MIQKIQNNFNLNSKYIMYKLKLRLHTLIVFLFIKKQKVFHAAKKVCEHKLFKNYFFVSQVNVSNEELPISNGALHSHKN